MQTPGGEINQGGHICQITRTKWSSCSTLSHARMHTHTQAHLYACIDARKHTYACMHTQTCQCTPILPYTIPGHPLTNINRSLRGNRGRRISLGHNGRSKSKRDTPFGFLSFGSCRLSPGFWQHRSTKCQRRGFGRLTRLMMDSFLQTFRCTNVAKKNGSSGFRPQRIKAWWDPRNRGTKGDSQWGSFWSSPS